MTDLKSEAVYALEVQHRYMKRALLESDEFEKHVKSSISEKERSPYDIFEHSIFTLYRHSFAGVNDLEVDKPTLESIEFSFNSDLPIRESILDGYERAIAMFKELRLKFDNGMDDVIHEESGTIRRQAYATISMHTMHHNAQAMLLTNIFIRNH